MSSINTKISFNHVQGARLISFTDYETLTSLGLQKNTEFDNWEIEIGGHVTIGENEYVVTSVYSIIEKQMMDNTSGKGMSFFVIGERYDYNFTVIYTVDDVK